MEKKIGKKGKQIEESTPTWLVLVARLILRACCCFILAFQSLVIGEW